LELSLVFERILEGMRTTRERCFRDSWDHLSLGKSVGELLPPRDETVAVKHYHYRAVQRKLIDGYKWLAIREREHPDFIEADAQHRSLERFPPEVTLAAAIPGEPNRPEPPAPSERRVSFNASEAANYIGVSARTITNWIRDHKLMVYNESGTSYQFSLDELNAKKAVQESKKSKKAARTNETPH
jgi:excisionase family DNA binding protein